MVPAKANCYITKDAGKKSIHLRAKNNINSNVELLWCYGKSYIMRHIFADLDHDINLPL